MLITIALWKSVKEEKWFPLSANASADECEISLYAHNQRLDQLLEERIWVTNKGSVDRMNSPDT